MHADNLFCYSQALQLGAYMKARRRIEAFGGYMRSHVLQPFSSAWKTSSALWECYRIKSAESQRLSKTFNLSVPICEISFVCWILPKAQKEWMCAFWKRSAVCFIPRVASCHILLPEQECFWWQQEKRRVTEKQECLLKQDHNDKRHLASNRQITDLKILLFLFILRTLSDFFQFT